VAKFFEKLGFHEVERGALPLKAWKDCMRCPKFQCCDETAVIKYLVTSPRRDHIPGLAEFAHFPILKQS
jgi:amino-acid N-acetyltransferase